MRRIVTGLLLMTAAAVCMAFSNQMNPKKLNVGKLTANDAVIVVSTGADQGCLKASSLLYVAPSGSPYLKKVAAGFQIDGSLYKGDFHDHQGFLNAAKLAPGKYDAYVYVLHPGLEPTQLPKFEFSIAAGETLYLGEFYLTVACQFSMSVGGFRDQQERDLALLRTQNPQLADRMIVKRIPEPAGYIVDKK